jgi:hypothetical protein
VSTKKLLSTTKDFVFVVDKSFVFFSKKKTSCSPKVKYMRGHSHSRALCALAAVSALALACLVVHSRTPRVALLSKVRCF